MLNAGHETSTNMLSHGMCEFINNKDQLDLLRNDETLICIRNFQNPKNMYQRIEISNLLQNTTF